MSLIRVSADNPAALLAAAVLLFVLGVVEMSSDVRAGNGNVHLVFDVGTDLQQAMLDVLNALNRADPAPPDADH